MAAPSTTILDLTQLKLQAKELLAAHRAGDRSAFARIRTQLSRLTDAGKAEIARYALALREAQFVVARENGFESWAALKKHVEAGSRSDEDPTQLPDVAPMTVEQVSRFWGRAFMSDDERPLTPAEQAFIAAAVIPGESRWDGTCDVERMEAVVRQDPGVLQSVGPALVNITLSTRGCAPALQYLLDRNVPFLVDEHRAKEGKEYEYDCVHEASWAGCVDNLRVLFESGVADATGTSNPHTGWPDNVSLLYWPAVFGTPPDGARDGVALTRLLLQHGADPEIRIKGNGERGNTVLQEALSPGHKDEWRSSKQQVAQVLIERGAHYDVFSACALDDVDRLRECGAERADIALATGEADMTPLHWAARAGAVRCGEWLLTHGADVDALTTTRRTPLMLAAENGAADSVWLLSEHGADLDVQDAKGRTPLHRAAYQGRVEAAEALIVLGADTAIEMKSGKKPLEVARLGCKFLKQDTR